MKPPWYKRLFQASSSYPEGSKEAALTGKKPGTSGNFNKYKTKETQRTALRKMYDNESENGQSLAGVIVDNLKSWIAGNGVNYSSENEKISSELKRIVEYNKLNSIGFINLVKDSIFDGEVLLYLQKKIHPVYKKEYIRIDILPIGTYKYKIIYSETDQMEITEIQFKDASGKDQKIKPEEFVYLSFGNSTLLSNCLGDLERLDELGFRFSRYNDKFGYPSPHFETKDQSETDYVIDGMKRTEGVDELGNPKKSDSINWDSGDMTIGPFKVTYLEPTGSGAISIEKEFNQRIQKISGASHNPIHLLGFVSLFGTAAGADSVLEQINTGTNEYRESWKYILYEMCIKSLLLLGNNIDEVEKANISVQIPLNTMIQMMMLKEFWIPMFDKNLVDRETILEMCPGIDPEIVNERIKNSDSKSIKDTLKNFTTKTENPPTGKTNDK